MTLIKINEKVTPKILLSPNTAERKSLYLGTPACDSKGMIAVNITKPSTNRIMFFIVSPFYKDKH